MSSMPEIDAVRHLLRNLENPSELRRNPLISSRFPGSSSDREVLVVTRAVVHATVAWMSQHRRKPRLHDVFVRCCLRGEPRKGVAAELGITVRQLFRDCREAYAAFVNAVVRADTLQTLPAGVSGSDEAVSWLLRRALHVDTPQERLTLILRALEYAVPSDERVKQLTAIR